MSNYSSIRAAANIDRRASNYANGTAAPRVPSTATTTDPKAASQGGYGINASDRRRQRQPLQHQPESEQQRRASRQPAHVPTRLRDEARPAPSKRAGSDGPPGRKVCKGGSVLGLITSRLATMAGDPAARTLLTSLLRDASRPYMAMLNEWLHHGGIRDPHGEFLIKEQKSIRREGLEQDYTDEYWEKRYTIREPDVPPQLEAVKEKVLLAGKYLNVVRECGGVDISKEVSDVPTSFDDPRFLENVNSAYAYANSALLNLLLTTHALPARLRSLKHYFFLDRSDFFSYFLELGGSELRKQAKLVNTGKLQSLLDIVLRQPGSVAAEDPYKEDVKVQMNEMGLTNWLMRVVNVTGLDQDAANQSMSNLLTPAPPTSATDDKDIKGFDALTLDYLVPFPLSLVISRVTLTRYQLLFRYLLSLRHLETLLVGSWTEHMKGPSWRHRSKNPRIELWKRKAWTLRARMLVFVQQLLYFCTSEVIEPNWQSLMSRVNETQSDDSQQQGGEGRRKPKRTVDELMQDHVDFLSTCLRECMLTNSKLLRVSDCQRGLFLNTMTDKPLQINSKVMTTCTMFAKFTAHLSRYLVSADPELAAKAAAASSGANSDVVANTSIASAAGSLAYNPKKLDEMFDVLQKYEDNFLKHLKILLDALNYLAATETVVFLGLCARLSTAAEGVQGLTVGLRVNGCDIERYPKSSKARHDMNNCLYLCRCSFPVTTVSSLPSPDSLTLTMNSMIPLQIRPPPRPAGAAEHSCPPFPQRSSAGRAVVMR
ncbi:hypothetical protein FH972_022203 [Carpinus fangiana]|uniref:Gamma-tubulin complex component n=1 Tax=Carpinus fangiana TaxID=176857 RepID=A0A5N6KRW9_9ROSI|nr:hypothetical protein FH972_022203 [Carpinus fangiana]